MYYGALSLTSAPRLDLAFPEMLAAASGLLILAGLWTPLAGSVAAVVELWIAFAYPTDVSMDIVLAVLALTLAMIGPGAWSVDARLFGRKQIDPDF